MFMLTAIGTAVIMEKQSTGKVVKLQSDEKYENVGVDRINALRNKKFIIDYFGILLDDNNRKPICRLHFNGKRKYVTFFDNGKEEKVEIQSNNQLYEYASRLIKAVD